MLFGTLTRAKDKRLNKIISYWIAQSVGWGALITMGLLFQQEEVSLDYNCRGCRIFYYRNRIVTDSTVHNSKVELAEVESFTFNSISAFVQYIDGSSIFDC